MFCAGAALDQPTFDGLHELGAVVRGKPVSDARRVGHAETAPDVTLTSWRTPDARTIGLPLPGVTVKLAPHPTGKYELRAKGPCVMHAYHRDPEATARAFDDEGYLLSGDACAFLDPNDHDAGLVFDGRLADDFKLSSGTWVRAAQVRETLRESRARARRRRRVDRTES